MLNRLADRFLRRLLPLSAPASDSIEPAPARQPSVEWVAPVRDVHQGLIQTHFSGRVQFDATGPVIQHPLLILAFTNRSGSNLLGDYLRQTGTVGGMGEYLNSDTARNLSTREGLNNFPDYLHHLSQRLCKPGQMFGVKASAEQLGFLRDWRLIEMFSRVSVIHIHRDDLMAQAVSHWIARETGQWTSLQKRRSDQIRFDAERILNIARDITTADHAIRRECALSQLPYLSASYEELRNNPKVLVDRIGLFAGLDTGDWQPAAPKIAKQANETNVDFLARLADYMRG